MAMKAGQWHRNAQGKMVKVRHRLAGTETLVNKRSSPGRPPRIKTDETHLADILDTRWQKMSLPEKVAALINIPKV